MTAHERMNEVSAEIRWLDEQIRDVWFDYEDKHLSLKPHPHPYSACKIFLGEKPLIEHKFSERLKFLVDARGFVDRVLDKVDELTGGAE